MPQPNRRAAMLTVLLALAPAALPAMTLAPFVTDPEFRFDPAIAVFAGGLKPEHGRSGRASGIEINLNSALLQPDDKRFRTHLVFSRYARHDLELTSAEFSPRYTLPIGSGFSIGFGPGVAYLRSLADGRRIGQAAWLLATGLSYREGNRHAGVDLRYLDAREKSVGGPLDGTTRDPDHWALTAKFGFHF